MKGAGEGSMQKLYRFSCNFILVLALVFTGMLLVSGFLFTCYAQNMTTQEVLTVTDNPLFNLTGAGIFLLFLYFVCRLVCGHASKLKPALLILTFVWISILGGILVLFGRTAPAADAWSVYSAAQSLAVGDTSVIHPTDSYLSYYPQQVGLLSFFELLVRLWNLLPADVEAYHFIKCLYVLLTCVIVFFQYRTVHLLWEDDRTDCLYLILAGTNLPLIMYSSFVYGETPSFAAMSAGLYFLMRILKEDYTPKSFLRRAAACLFFLTLSVMLRKNSLIMIIAAVLVIVLEGLPRKNKRLLLTGLLCVMLSVTILPATQKVYELRAGNYLKTGVPAMSYFAMGMQESSRGNGWYNGYNFDTYQDNDMDTSAAVSVSKEYITERTAYFKAHPDYAAAFYFYKYLSQWADGTYASRQATLATLGERHPLLKELYTGAYSSLYIGFCNHYQNILYLGCFVFFFIGTFKKGPGELYPYLGVIAAFGGFLFHMIWEANSRYIFLYGLLLIPYAANGLASLTHRGEELFNSTSAPEKSRRNNTDHTQDATPKPPTAI